MTEVVDCGDGGWLMADGAKSRKSLARTLFLVFGGKTIGRYPLPEVLEPRSLCYQNLSSAIVQLERISIKAEFY